MTNWRKATEFCYRIRIHPENNHIQVLAEASSFIEDWEEMGEESEVDHKTLISYNLQFGIWPSKMTKLTYEAVKNGMLITIHELLKGGKTIHRCGYYLPVNIIKDCEFCKEERS